ncbi:nucleotidyl transferase AbiEii/AbiGii toxin family protein [Sphaerimonospora thailandensis]|uniref:Nucleotidyltransferase AbiEii toxin of type IV toxin-antitoxin system n=1 Tax=Sphaerimonospora thailandensis TaxID=795644 RepID=A0A8J3W097_9ACTN|nr:nucleotidyl transferase AbiEii/AbiGii toxin family protein [Sphaerimonospora thailandensis]GIH70621.1 hypothetical protein Mth01_28740 [Sphaerimonospora thailandensis]
MPALLEGDHALLMQAALPVCDRYGLVLAGGYAIKAHGLVTRPSDDIDFATASSAPMEEIVNALAHTYQQAGLETSVISAQDRKGHLLVRFPHSTRYRIDILKEPLNHPPSIMSFGPVLSMEDAVALKVGALHDRGLPRDLIDVHAATEYFSDAELAAMARRVLGEDFFPEDLRDQLEHAAVYQDEEFAVYGCGPDEINAMRAWAQQWADRLGLELAENELWTDKTSD